jgi:aryl-alcohol dehydrogenase-like predicted oxidoreductase
MTQPLPTAVLGRTGLEVTRLGYGAGHRKPMNDRQRETILNAVLDGGVNFIDTAASYGNSEELIGRYLSHRRSDFYIATKGHDWSREGLTKSLDESLRRLKTDYVDVLQPHNPSVEECERGDLVEAMRDMQSEGKVRWLGISTTLPHLPTFLEWGVFDVFQVPYSALERDHEEWITRSAEAGMGILVRGGVALGEPGVGTGSPPSWAKFDEAGLDDLRQEGESRTAFVLRFTLTHPHSHTNIAGTTDPDHLRENVEAISRGPLDADVYEEAKRRLDAAGVRPTQ